MSTDLNELQQRIRAAAANNQALCIKGNGSKDFYGGALQGEVISAQSLTGIVDYEPTELVITARAGTLLVDIDAALSEHGQMLAFEPPNFSGRATLGGAVAAGLSGPRRAYAGALRDFVLGVRLLDGKADDLRFGGQVIKNVAGFDVSRLMAGSMGTLGLMTEVTLKTLPRPPEECTLQFSMAQAQALRALDEWAAQPLPISASLWHAGYLWLRLSGASAAVRAARSKLGGEVVAHADSMWNDLREQRHNFFDGAQELWRVSVPARTPMLDDFSTLIEWSGQLRWLKGPLDVSGLRARIAQCGGHATLYRAVNKSLDEVFHPPAPALLALHQRLKAVFDPHRIFNRGRLYPTL